MSSGAEVTLSSWRVWGVSREEQILPPGFLTLINAWGLVTTPGNYWEGPQGQLSRGQGEFSVFPVGEPKFRVKVITGRDTHNAPGLPSLFPVGHFPSWSHFSRLFQSVFSLIISLRSGGWAFS